MEPLTHLDIIKRKIIGLNQLQHAFAGGDFYLKLNFTNGTFDILHLGHALTTSPKRPDLGDILSVGVNSDASTSRLKGPHRPINNEEQRSILLAALHLLFIVIIFDDPALN
ncbi:MAG: adenylyltransferase/cytidyltransferase family protein [Bacteroidetes bacterium]|nr:adenylyltransferase/cytidyltransferase family protein [Bacteroidota bacterium]